MSHAEEVRAELDRVGASYRSAGAASYVAVHELDEELVWLKGPPLSGRVWKGRPLDALDLLRPLPDDAGVDAVWSSLE